MSDHPTNANGPAPDTIAADIQALYDQFSPPQKTWFMEQLRRGARGETTFLSDEEQAFDVWIAAPVQRAADPAPSMRVPDTIDVEDDINEARHRLHAVRLAVNGLHCREDRNALGYWIDDIDDMLDDASSTLTQRRQEGGAA